MSKYTAEEIKAAASTVQSMRWHADEGEEMMRVADMLRDYAAHLAAQAEWPSEADVEKVIVELGHQAGFYPRTDHMRAALQYVRPPVGVVSDEDIAAATKAFFDARVDVSELDDAGTSTRICAALESYASRHAPTKD